MTEAWHFLPSNRCTRFTTEGPLEAGSVLRVDPDRLKLCHYGLHASTDILDALRYAPGPIVCRVMMRGKILHGTDKMCASEREILWITDATDVLRAFARECALRVIHLWNAPPVVREYLETGREDLRCAARTVAFDAYDGAWDAGAWDAGAWAVVGAARTAANTAANTAASAAAGAWDVGLDTRIAKDADRADGAEREWQRARLEEMISPLAAQSIYTIVTPTTGDTP